MPGRRPKLMGEYIRYKGEEIKIGTCENLYYTTYEKFINALKSGQLSNVGSTAPEEYAKPDSGFRFRFPFPDEDNIPFGNFIDPYHRGIAVTIDQDAIPDSDRIGHQYQMEITQQKLIHRQSDGKLCLALVWRDPVNHQSYRVEDEKDIKAIVRQIVRNHIISESNHAKKDMYRKIAVRILKGYRMETPGHALKQKERQPLRALPYSRTKPTKRKGL